jgi:Gpi18-like mannosyltransferase
VFDAAAALAVSRAILLIVGIAVLSGSARSDLDDVRAFHTPHPGTPSAAQMWARWDSEWYLQIAEHGYAGRLPGPPVFDMRPNFFPLYPLALRLLTAVTGNAITSGLTVSNLALFVALVLLHGWTSRRLDRNAARALVWVYAAFPSSFFLSAVYAEALLLGFLALTWRMLEFRRWTAAGLCAAAAALCRPVGIIAAPVAMLAAARDAGWKVGESRRRLVVIALPVVVAVVGYVLVFAWVLHDPRAALRTETLTRAGFRWPWTTLIDAWQQGIAWYSYERGSLDWTLAVVAVALLPVVFLTLDVVAGVFAVLMVLFPLTSGLYSYSRLLLPAFPIFIVIAARTPRRVLIPLVMASMALQSWLFAQFVRWEWIA